MGKANSRRKERNDKGEWRPAFLAALRNSGIVRASCEAAGVSRPVAYKHRNEDDAFRAEWDDALEDAKEMLEAVARQRALAKSDLMMIFLLKALDPAKYRENVRPAFDQGGAVRELMQRMRAAEGSG